MEFLFSIIFVFFVFLLLLGFVFQRRAELDDTKDFLDKRKECTKIGSLISAVYSAGDGTVAEIKTDYLITIRNYSRVVVESTGDYNITRKENVSCSFAAETFNYQFTGDLMIRNENGNIIINEI